MFASLKAQIRVVPAGAPGVVVTMVPIVGVPLAHDEMKRMAARAPDQTALPDLNLVAALR
jgi:hypothetical protein